tara:strand:- start:165 stop:419 length:255 start_codon:yes stop_codon:yes gene_type:complete
MTQQELHNLVYGYKTKNKEGFTPKEMFDLLNNNFPKITKEQFNNCIGVRTCIIIEGEIITYHTDIFYALLQIIEGRNLKWFEFD